MFPLFETICVKKGQIQHLPWHQERMDHAHLLFFEEPNKHQLSKIIKVPKALKSIEKVKVRISYNKDGTVVLYEPYIQKKIESLKVVFDDHINYSLKWTDRHALQTLLNKRGNHDDILIIKNGMVTDSSYCNIVFEGNNNKWYTPDTPLLPGTCRNRLLQKSVIEEVAIHHEEIQNFKSFMLINAMLNFDRSRRLPINKIYE